MPYQVWHYLENLHCKTTNLIYLLICYRMGTMESPENRRRTARRSRSQVTWSQRQVRQQSLILDVSLVCAASHATTTSTLVADTGDGPARSLT